MKRTFLLLILIALVSITQGNIATPQANISEIYFDSTGNWTIELGFSEWNINDIDSIRLVTSSGSSIINYFNIIQGGGFPNFDSLAVITNSNLKQPLTINTTGDFIKLISYSWGDEPYDYVAFGNFPGSTVDCIINGESISYLCYIESMGYTGSFCIDKSPTIGIGNDTTGAISTFKGSVFDLSNNVFSSGWFPIPDVFNTIIHINPDGTFSERIFSRRYIFDTIQIYFPPWPLTVKKFAIEPINFCLKPDSIHHQNIITTSFISGLSEYNSNFEKIITSPNPFTNKISFYFNIKVQNPVEKMDLLIFFQNGRKLKHIELLSNQTRFDWTIEESTPSGVYFYQLITDNKILSSGKIIKL